MKYKKFFISLVILISCTYSLYLYFVSSLIENPKETTHSYKEYILRKTSEIPRIIVDSGSNSQHGINSQILSERFGLPVINVSDNASYPLTYKLSRLEKFTKSGDTLILPLEWAYYGKQSILPETFAKEIFIRLAFYYWDVSLLDKFTILNSIPVNMVLDGLFNNRTAWGRKDEEMFWDALELRAHKSPSGDVPSDQTFKEDKFSNESTCADYIFEKLSQNNFTITDAFYDSIKRIKSLQGNGVNVIVTWPAVVGQDCYEQYQDDFNNFYDQATALYKEEGIPFVGDANDSYFDKNFIRDTHYHLNNVARDVRTKRLADNIEQSGLISKGNGLVSLSRYIVQSIHDDKLALAESLLPLNGLVEFKNDQELQHALLGSGWSPREDWGVWSDGRTSEILLRFDALKEDDLNLLVDCYYFNNQEETDVFVNGSFLLRQNLETNPSLKIPRTLLDNGKGYLTLKFSYSSTSSPFDLGLGDDHRQLKLGLKSLRRKG
jgi:hypothetical protein